MGTKETDFEMLARLIKEEGEDIRTGLADLGNRMDSGFARADQELASIRADMKSQRVDIDQLQKTVARHDRMLKR